MQVGDLRVSPSVISWIAKEKLKMPAGKFSKASKTINFNMAKINSKNEMPKTNSAKILSMMTTVKIKNKIKIVQTRENSPTSKTI